MKTILAIYFAAVTLTLGAGTNFGNVVSLDTANVLPDHIRLDTQDIAYHTLKQLQAAGWRKIVAEDAPAEGYRITGQAVQQIDGTTAKLIVTSSVNIAKEAAAQAAAELAAKQARRAYAKAQLDSDPVMETLLWGVCQCAVKSGLAANAAAAKQLLVTHFDAIPL